MAVLGATGSIGTSTMAVLRRHADRFRPVVLTAVTTFAGLTPLLSEGSISAQFLIPMAIAIAVGLMSATVMILVVLPCFMLIFEDLKAGLYFLWHGRSRPDPVMRGATPREPSAPCAGGQEVI